MKKMKKLLSLVLAVVMVIGLLPMKSFATEKDVVYISVSYDGKYIDDQNGKAIVYVPIFFDELKAIDLNDYGLSDYLYDEDGDGTYETTALQLVIYAHEKLYGGSWDDVKFTGAPGSSYFEGGIFGFDENLNYFLNGEYPLAGEGWGATSDQIVLEAGDFIDIASFSSWDFYTDSNYGFHFFADSNGEFVHGYTVEEGAALPVKLVRSYSGMGVGAIIYDEADYTVYYGTSYDNPSGEVITDGSGCADITFPSAGTWYLWADGGYGLEFPDVIVSAPGYAEVTVTAKEEEPAPEPENPDTGETQDVSSVLNAAMAKMAATITEPVFGTTAGEWTVFSLARGGYYAKDSQYFTDYYKRIVETVNEEASSVDMNGALHKSKSTENSRLIVALSAIGKDATSVGNWNLIEPYSANGFDWIKKQGLNGTIWALIALDSNNYTTMDTTIRQQCVDAVLAAQHTDGGWSLIANKETESDPDITGMALTALYPYRNQEAVAKACAEAIECLSKLQHDNGTFASGGSECSESCAWAIIAATTWGINPDTDSRFVKNGNSAVDGLLAHYVEEEAMFQHIIGAGTNAMGTDQGCYGLVAYDRFVNGEAGLYDFSDVIFDEAVPETDDMTATLGLPAQINSGDKFNAVISVNKWDKEAGYKLIDFIMTVPEGVTVTNVTAGERLDGGEVSYNVDGEGKLRVVYFDAEKNADLQVSGTEFPAELFKVEFEANEVANTVSKLDFTIEGMSVKLTSDSTDENAMVVVNTEKATGSVEIVFGISFTAVELYTGDDVDLIPSTKKAVAVAVTGISGGRKLTYKDETTTIDFMYSAEITNTYGIATYVGLVDAAIDTNSFVNERYMTLPGGDAAPITFGESNGDGVVNAQDALAAVNAWLRKSEVLEEDGTLSDMNILTLNVNGDSRVNTFDALGIVESFVNNTVHNIVTMAANAFAQSAN